MLLGFAQPKRVAVVPPYTRGHLPLLYDIIVKGSILTKSRPAATHIPCPIPFL